MATMKGYSEKPSFLMFISPSLKQGFTFPDEFLKHLKGHDQYEHAILRWANKNWPVKLNGVRLEDGLEKFVEQNNLEEGEILSIEYEGNMKFEAIRFDPSKQCEILEVQPRAPKVVKSSDESKSKEAATQKHSGCPYFVCTIRPYSFKYGYLCLPLDFVKKNNLHHKIGDLIIRDEKQRSWNIRLNCFSSKRFVLNGGWPEFSNANDIKEGDEVMFEIVSNEEKQIWEFKKKASNNVRSSLLIEPPKVKSGRPSQRRDIKDMMVEVVHMPIDKLIHKNKSSFVANTPKSKSRELRQRQELEDQTLKAFPHRSFDESNHNIKSAPLAKTPKPKSRRPAERDDFEDRSLEVVTHMPNEPSKLKLGGLHQRQEFEERTFEAATHKSLDKPTHKKLKSTPLAGPSQSKLRELPQKQNFEDQTTNVATQKPHGESNYYTTSSKEATPLKDDPHKSSDNPCILINVNPYCLVTDTLLIPEKFALANDLFRIKKCDLIIRDDNDRSWNVTLREHNNYVFIKDGWKKIRDTYYIKEGDQIMFEIVTGGDKPIWKFHGKISKEFVKMIQQNGLEQ